MFLQVCAVRDAKTDIFSQPMFFVTKGAAIRAFFDECQRSGSEVMKHAEDFSFWFLGTFNDQNGYFDAVPAPERLALAIDCKKE